MAMRTIPVWFAGLLMLLVGCSAGEPGPASAGGAGVSSRPTAPASAPAATSAAPAAPATAAVTPAVTTPPAAVPAAGSARCTALMVQRLKHRFGGDVRIARCRNGYARAFSPAVPGGEQYYLEYRRHAWQVVTSGTGLDCSDPYAGRGLLRACGALRYPTTNEPERITDPRLAAERMVRAWVRHDTVRAMQLGRDDGSIEGLFSQRAPASVPTGTGCRLISLGRFACSYPLAPRAELTLIVSGGASAGYEVTGVEFGD
jgi:hypothetical protein